MFGSHAAELTVDQLEQVVESASGAISGATAVMLTAIRALDTAQVATADGARSMAEWVAGRFDLEPATARTLVDLARATDSELEDLLESGSVTADRAAAVVRLKNAGADDRILAESWGRDLTGVRQMVAGHRRITAAEESDMFGGRFLHLQPSLDESRWKVWGQLGGPDGRMVDKALQTATDSLPDDPDITASQARADSLVSVASEWLAGEIGGHDTAVEIFIDAALATASNGEAGATVVEGPRVGPTTLG
jgi:hypothetical protein